MLMKLSIILAILLMLFISYQCLKIKKDECPYGAVWSYVDKSKIVLPPVSERKTVPALRYSEGIRLPKEVASRGMQSPSSRPIPRLIMQTNEKREIPVKMFEATSVILNLNPGYDYIYFTDDDAADFLRENFNERVNNAYHRLIPGAYKADLFRYCFLLVRGGVYVDMGMVGLAPFDKIIRDTDTFIAPEDNGTNGIYNAFMAVSPGHPIIQRAIELSVRNIEEENYTHSPLGITGPLLLSIAFESVTRERVSPGKDYEGVRLIKFNRFDSCESGIVHDEGLNILATRYPGYRVDQMWYNSGSHYSEMWKERKVFDSYRSFGNE